MLSPRVVRTLEPLSAASGLVAVGDQLYVVADDRDELGAFPRRGSGPGRLIAGIEREAAPEDPVERKAWKADLEALVAVPGGGLLAMGSGSTPARRAGVHWPAPSSTSPPRGRPRAPATRRSTPSCPTSTSRAPASRRAPRARPARQRRRGRRRARAVRVGSRPRGAAGRARPVPASALLAVHPVTGLGTAEDGTPLTLTDLTALPDGRLLATAVAEQGESTYLDGACVGAAVAVLRPDGRVEQVQPFTDPWKVEGILAEPRGDGTVDLLMCVDPDDPDAIAPLLGATLRPLGAQAALELGDRRSSSASRASGSSSRGAGWTEDGRSRSGSGAAAAATARAARGLARLLGRDLGALALGLLRGPGGLEAHALLALEVGLGRQPVVAQDRERVDAGQAPARVLRRPVLDELLRGVQAHVLARERRAGQRRDRDRAPEHPALDRDEDRGAVRGVEVDVGELADLLPLAVQDLPADPLCDALDADHGPHYRGRARPRRALSAQRRAATIPCTRAFAASGTNRPARAMTREETEEPEAPGLPGQRRVDRPRATFAGSSFGARPDQRALEVRAAARSACRSGRASAR
jgi:hypothetical protein